jgi:HNH endonuclease
MTITARPRSRPTAPPASEPAQGPAAERVDSRATPPAAHPRLRIRRYTPAAFWTQLFPIGECRVWLGHHDAAGYGFVTYQGRSWRVHRLAWTLTHGPIPPGLDVLHRCDTPPCARPEHLFLGTDMDNATDRIAKGRHRRGRRSPSDHEILFIRQTAALGVPRALLARETGLSRTFIRDVILGNTRTRSPGL